MTRGIRGVFANPPPPLPSTSSNSQGGDHLAASLIPANVLPWVPSVTSQQDEGYTNIEDKPLKEGPNDDYFIFESDAESEKMEEEEVEENWDYDEFIIKGEDIEVGANEEIEMREELDEGFYF